MRPKRLAVLAMMMFLGFSTVESAFASTCLHRLATTSSHAQHDAPDLPGSDTAPDDQSTDCPLNTAAGCTAPASILTSAGFTVGALTQAMTGLQSPASALDRIFSSSAFHPPRN